MPSGSDIILGGSEFMVQPGSYKRASDGVAEGRPGRVVQRDFFGGQRRATQFERDRGWDSVGVRSVLGGQGVEPWPLSSLFVDVVTSQATRFAGNAVRWCQSGSNSSRTFVSVGSKLYRGAQPGTPWAGMLEVADLSHPITSVAHHHLPGGGVRVLAARATSAEVASVNPDGGGVTTIGERGEYVASYGGVYAVAGAFSGDRNRLLLMDGTDRTEYRFEAPIVGLELHDGALIVATARGLHRLTGTWLPAVPAHTTSGGATVPREPARWSTPPVPFYTLGSWMQGSDLEFLQSFNGRLYTWANNGVSVFGPDGEGGEGWQPTGLEGHGSYGCAVAGGYLVVAMRTWSGRSELWAFDGVAWWLIGDRPIGSGEYCWPVPTSGSGEADIVVFRSGSTSTDLVRLVPRSSTAWTYPTAGQYISSMMDVGDRDKPKAWRRVGAVWGSPERRGNQSSTTSPTTILSVSADAGRTWSTVSSLAQPGPGSGTHRGVVDQIGAIASGLGQSSTLMVRVGWSGVSDWAPVLLGLWLEYELFDAPTHRRRWSFAVVARDRSIDRDAAADSRTGRQLAAEIWAAWDGGEVLPFRDVDYDDDPTTRRVRVVGIEEAIGKPADNPRYHDAVLKLALVEV